MNQTMGQGALSAEQLEAILLEVGRQIMERGPQAMGEIGQWAQACLSAPDLITNGPSGAIGAVLPYGIAARKGTLRA